MEDFYSKQVEKSGKHQDYESFYISQAGGSIDPYISYRYLPGQRGRGFFGNLFRSSIMPLIHQVMPYLKDTVVSGVEGVVEGIKEGRSLKDSAKRQLKRTASTVLQDMASKISRQSGSGLKHKRRRRRTKRVKITKRRVRRTRKRTGKKTCLIFK